MKKTMRIAVLLLLSLLLAVSCSPEKVQDGKSAETKKTMTSEEYRVNKEAIKGLGVVEAYAVVNSGSAVPPETRGLTEDGLKLTFDKKEPISSSSLIAALEEKASAAEKPEEKAFYSSLASSLPKECSLEVEKGSFVIYKTDANGIKVVSSLSIDIIIDGKTIEIEKDEDEKWLEIDGTFFDNTELEKMLDSAEDAVEALEDFFENIGQIKLDFGALISGKDPEFTINVKGDEGIEAKIEGSFGFELTNNMLSLSFDFKYTELDGEEVENEFTLVSSILMEKPISITAINLEDSNILDVSVKINGMDVWSDAFLEELD